MEELDAQRGVVLDVIREARALSLSWFRRGVHARSKRDGSTVSDADLAVEELVVERLSTAFPGDAVVAEERGAVGSGRRVWFVDAIDGSTHFVRRSPNWSTMVALAVDREVRLAVIDQPALGVEYWASADGGAFCRQATTGGVQRLCVREAGYDVAPRSFVPRRVLSRKDPQLLALLESELDVRERCGNAVAQVACGELDVALYMDVDPWDVAAPSLLIEEAGGRFTDLRGGRSLHTGHALFTSGRHHERLLQLVSAVNCSAALSEVRCGDG